ncbi:hypothetical protein KML24007_04150 [Alistipes indistinctus]
MVNKKAGVRLTGRWRLSRRFNVNGANEHNLRGFGLEEYIIEFLMDGVMTVTNDGLPISATYQYEPASRIISIEFSDSDSESPLAGDTPFRIIPLNEREMYFQRLSSVEVNPFDDSFEVILFERK